MFSHLFLLLFLLSSPMLSTCEDLTSFVYAGCSEGKYTVGTPYQLNIDSLMASLANAASFSSYSKFTSSAAGSSAEANGLFQCRGDLLISDCASCVHSAISQLSTLCTTATGAAVQLRGCYLRYGNDSFLGKPDTTLLYKKCGPDASGGGGGGSDLLGMRDNSLSTLCSTAAPPAGGLFRVGATGDVQAMAQCVGDQSGKECDDCVSTAVAQLKASCGFAVAGDVYLGKCYARYSSNGDYAPRFDHDHGHGDDNGKTVALIIGLMAGVALIIIFASFIRRAGNYGK